MSWNAIATDNLGSQTMSSNVTITIAAEPVAGEGYWDQNFSELIYSNYLNDDYESGAAYVAIGPNGDIIGFTSQALSEENIAEAYFTSPGPLLDSQYADGSNSLMITSFSDPSGESCGDVVSYSPEWGAWPAIDGRTNECVYIGGNYYGCYNGWYFGDLPIANPLLDVLTLNGTNWQALTTNSGVLDCCTNISSKGVPYISIFTMVQAIASLGGEIYVGGAFIDVTNLDTQTLDTNVQYVAKLDGGGHWVSVATNNLNGQVLALCDSGWHI